MKEPNLKLWPVDARGPLWTAGGVLLFWLLNIEIADYFTPISSQYTVLEFRDINLARDMTYSIAWGAFALALILLGVLLNTRGARYAGIGLMAVTLLKVFLHDLASLESIYRIAALIGVAVVALAASFLYQRFFDKTKPSEPPRTDFSLLLFSGAALAFQSASALDVGPWQYQQSVTRFSRPDSRGWICP